VVRSQDVVMDAVIREPVLDDAAALGRMHFASWREAYAGLLPAGFFTPEGEAQRIEGWRANLAGTSSDVVLRIADRDGEVVGFATAGPGRPNDSAGPPVRERELWALYVRASEYGSGLAARLLEVVLPREVPAELWVFEANPRARAFYTKHGFVPDGARHVLGPDLGDQAEIRLVR
jgi:GNAT superfamily N-acetyltransferase